MKNMIGLGQVYVTFTNICHRPRANSRVQRAHCKIYTYYIPGLRENLSPTNYHKNFFGNVSLMRILSLKGMHA